jgi:hypothetical protein
MPIASVPDALRGLQSPLHVGRLKTAVWLSLKTSLASEAKHRAGLQIARHALLFQAARDFLRRGQCQLDLDDLAWSPDRLHRVASADHIVEAVAPVLFQQELQSGTTPWALSDGVGRSILPSPDASRSPSRPISVLCCRTLHKLRGGARGMIASQSKTMPSRKFAKFSIPRPLDPDLLHHFVEIVLTVSFRSFYCSTDKTTNQDYHWGWRL